MLLQQGLQLLGSGDSLVKGSNVEWQASVSPSVWQQYTLLFADLQCAHDSGWRKDLPSGRREAHASEDKLEHKPQQFGYILSYFYNGGLQV